MMNIYRPDSELSRLNSRGRRPNCSPELCRLIRQNRWITGPALGRGVRYHRGAAGGAVAAGRETQAKMPDPCAIAAAVAATGSDKLRDGNGAGTDDGSADRCRVSFERPDMAVDMGAIAKGYGVDAVLEAVRISRGSMRPWWRSAGRSPALSTADIDSPSGYPT